MSYESLGRDETSCVRVATKLSQVTVNFVLVRPILEYACPVWNPHLVKHIHSIESIQRRATRMICGSVKSYSERLAVNIGAQKKISLLGSTLQDNSWFF